MSMLAERRRKTKWSLNPTGRFWSDDKNKFGQRMLEKMGWKEGCGLGAQLQGPKEHVRVSAKNDNKGLGFKSSDEAWFKVQEDYEKLLSEMSITYGGGAGTSPPRERKSLEEISRSTRTRIHYAKFIRGKDMSRYSEKDLACIFGKPLSKSEPHHQADSSHTVQSVKISDHFDTQTKHTSETSDVFETVGENTEDMGYVGVASMEDILNCSDDESQKMCKKKKKKKKKSSSECMDIGSELCENSHPGTCESSCQLEAKDSDTRVVGFVDNYKSHSNQYIDEEGCISQKVKKRKRKDSFDNEQYVDQNEQSIDSNGDQQRSADCIKCCRCGEIYNLNTSSLSSSSQGGADTQTKHTSETSDVFETVGENTEDMGYVGVASTEDIFNCSDDESQKMCKKKKKKKKKKSSSECMDIGSELCENSHPGTCGSSCQLEAKDSDTRVVGFVDNYKSHSNQYIDEEGCISQKVKKSKRKDSFDNEQYVDQNEQSIDSNGDQQRSADCIKCCRCGEIYNLNTSSLSSSSQGGAECYSRLYHEPTNTKRKKKMLKEGQNSKNLDLGKTVEAHSERKKKKDLKKDDDRACVSDEKIGLDCDNLDAQYVESKSDRKQEKRKKKYEFEMTSQSHDGNASEHSYKPSSLKSKLSTKTGHCVDSYHFNTDDSNEKLQKRKYEVDIQGKGTYKKKSSAKNQLNGPVGNEERCSSHPSDPHELDDYNSRKGHPVAEDICTGTSSDVSINGKKKKKERENYSFSRTLQVEHFLPIRDISMIDLDAFKGSNWANIKGYGNFIPNMQNGNS